MKSNFFFVIAAMFMFVSCMGMFEMDVTTDFDETYDVFSATKESDAATRTSLSDYSNEDGSYLLNWLQVMRSAFMMVRAQRTALKATG